MLSGFHIGYVPFKVALLACAAATCASACALIFFSGAHKIIGPDIVSQVIADKQQYSIFPLKSVAE